MLGGAMLIALLCAFYAATQRPGAAIIDGCRAALVHIDDHAPRVAVVEVPTRDGTIR